MKFQIKINQKYNKDSEFIITASHIFESYEDGNKLKIFATIFTTSYILYEKTLTQVEGSIILIAMTFIKDKDGKFILESYEQARDGGEFEPSIKEFSTMPVSGKKIKGLANKMVKHYSNYEDIIISERENLIKHLKKNNYYGISLINERYKEDDEVIPLT